MADQKELLKQAMETPSKKSGGPKKRNRGQNLMTKEDFENEHILTKLTK